MCPSIVITADVQVLAIHLRTGRLFRTMLSAGQRFDFVTDVRAEGEFTVFRDAVTGWTYYCPTESILPPLWYEGIWVGSWSRSNNAPGWGIRFYRF